MQAKQLISILALTLISGAVMAKATAPEVDRLGKDLTPTGAEKAGNKDGSIPAWDGGLTKAPAGFNAAKGYADPFAGEKPLFTITAQNAEQHKDKLSAGQLAMFKKYPQTYKMNVYTSHRTTALPKQEYDAVKKFAATAELVSGGNGVAGAGDSPVPFPLPKSGEEVLWNHALHWQGGSFERDYSWYVVQPSGSAFRVAVTDRVVSERSGYLEGKREDGNFRFIAYYRQPATLEGTIYLVQDSMDSTKDPRHAWIYNAGQRRVRRIPELCCDYAADGTEGLRLSDQYDGWNGQTDRYNWKLLGKKEMFIAYNNYKLSDKSLKQADVLKPGHINPELARYELHRVWAVEGTLKPEARHLYAKRTMYFDEDSHQLAFADLYDSRGALWRTQETYAMQFYDAQVPWYVGMSFNDLNSGAYSLDFAGFEEKHVTVFGKKFKASEFEPDALRRMGGK